jgi:hypothetical protein
VRESPGTGRSARWKSTKVNPACGMVNSIVSRIGLPSSLKSVTRARTGSTGSFVVGS